MAATVMDGNLALGTPEESNMEYVRRGKMALWGFQVTWVPATKQKMELGRGFIFNNNFVSNWTQKIESQSYIFPFPIEI